MKKKSKEKKSKFKIPPQAQNITVSVGAGGGGGSGNVKSKFVDTLNRPLIGALIKEEKFFHSRWPDASILIAMWLSLGWMVMSISQCSVK